MAKRTEPRRAKGRRTAARDNKKNMAPPRGPLLRDGSCAKLIDSASEAIVVGDSGGRILLVNRRTEEIFGYKRQELIGRPIEALMPERVRKIHAEHVKHYVADPHKRPMAPDLDIEGRRKDGTEFPLECGLGYVETEDGILVIAVMTDISERKRAEEALQESEERFRSLSEAAFEGIVVHEDGQILDANEAYARMFGYEVSEVIGTQVLDHVAPESRALVARNDQSSFAGPYEAVGLRKDGSTFPVEACGKTVSYKGRKVRVAATRDIAERRRAEEALRESEAVYRSLVETSPDAITLTDLKGKIVVCNEQAALLHGAAGVEDMIGRDAFEFVAPEDQQKANANMRKTLEMGSVRNIEYTLLALDGKRVPVELSASVVPNMRGEPTAFIGVVRDITERRRAEQALRQREGELQQLTARLLDVQERERRVVARELHDEIGQLLTGLNLSLEACVRSPGRVATDRIRDTQGLVDELVSRVSDLSLDLRPAMLDELGLLPALLWHFERYSSRTGVRVDFKHSGPKGRLAPDVETAAYRIIQEALTNVARHSRVSQAAVRVWGDGNRLIVQIEDKGTGFDLDAELAAGHAGGLASMQERAALCGGHVTIESAPGTGTRVTLEMPVGGASEQED